MAKSPIDVMLDSVVWTGCESLDRHDGLPYPTHEGVLDIAGAKIRVYQLNTGVRICDADDIENFFTSMRGSHEE